MQKDQIRILIELYMRGELTDGQKAELLKQAEDRDQGDSQKQDLLLVIRELMEREAQAGQGAVTDRPEDILSRQQVLQKVLGVDKTNMDRARPVERAVGRLQVSRSRYAWVAAAAVLVLIFAGYHFFHQPKKTPGSPIAQSRQNDVGPGSGKAVLTLGNGSKIILETKDLGVVAKQGSTHIVKTDSGKLAYEGSEGHPATPTYNTLAVPRGGTFQLDLSDGTKVWLNAASSITYPTDFSGEERRVRVTGEVYFEVAKNKLQPFFVDVNDLQIAVLGTDFNVNAYADEASVKTTLINGSVRVNLAKTNQSALMLPGQQTELSAGTLTINRHADIDQIVAWKDGSFDFESADLKTILRQFARWYDVDVVYDGPVTSRRFFAVVSRNTSLKKVLELLQDNNVKFEISGRKLIIKAT